MKLLAFSVGGITSPKTMKLRGKIQGREVLILIDSGANHNYISTKLVKEMDLDVEDTHPTL